jgi:hypothetical protein
MLKTLRDSYSYVTYNILLYLFISDRIWGEKEDGRKEV